MIRSSIPSTIFITLCLALFSSAWAQQPLPTDTTVYWQPYAPGSNTIALYQFEAPDPLKDLCGKASALQLPAGVSIVDGGKFGGGLAFAAGHQPVKITLGESLYKQQRFIIDFWVKLNALPAAGNRATLLYKPYVANKTNGLQCYVNADGSLVWTHRTLSSSQGQHPEWVYELKSAPGIIRAGTWQHIAVYIGAFTHVFGSDVGYLAVDGVQLQEQQHSWRYLDYTAKEQPGNELLLGGGDAQDAFTGTIDQFRIVSGLFRRFYPAPDESWIDADNTRPVPANPACVATGDDILFKLGFEDTIVPEIARGNAKPTRLLGKPEFVPGVKGKGLKALGGWMPLTFAAKDNLNPAMGAMEVWVKPLGWQILDARRPYFFLTDNGGPTAFIPNDGFTIQVTGGMENMEVDYQPNTWMHVVLVWAERQIALYVNGEKKLFGLLPAPFDPAKNYPAFAVPFNAEMLVDEFTIYRRPLSGEEVNNHYRRYFPKAKLTALPPIDSVSTVFQGVGKVLGVAYARQPLAAEPSTAKISLRQGGKSLVETRVPYTSQSGARFLVNGLPVPLPPGDINLRVELLKEDATPALSATVPFPVKRYAWLGNTLGISDRVLKPWTPMTEKGGVVETIGRRHTLARNGLFAQVVNHTRPMLAAPMRLEATANGTTTPLTGGTLTVTSRKPNVVAWQSSAMEKVGQGTLKVNTKATMEYDGQTVFTLTLTPGKGPVTLDRLSLVLPLKDDYVKLYNMIFGIGRPVGMGAPPSFGVFSDKPGPLFSSKIWYDYTGWDGEMQHTGIFDFHQAVAVEQKTGVKLEKRWKPTLGNFVPQFWLGDDDIGFSYMADNDAGWVPTDEAPAMTMERVGTTVEWRFNFISTPFTLTEPRTIVLSLQATPEKPQPAGWRKDFWRGPLPAPPGSVTASWLSDGAGFDEEGVGPYKYTPDVAKATADAIHATGGKATPHLDTSGMNWGAKTAGELAAEWDSGGFQYNYIFTRSKIDFAVWSQQRWKDQFNIDGVYFDTGTPTPNLNTITGTAYPLPDGRVQPGWTMFGQREYYKRSAYLFGDIGTQGFNWSCGYTGSQIAGWQFAAVPGGEYRIDYDMDRYPGPFELMRCYSNSGKHGTLMMWMGLSDYVKANESPRNFEKFMRHMLAMMLPLDAKWSFAGFNYPNCFYDFGYADDDVKFVGFWKNPYIAYQTPAEGMRTSLYLKPNGRALIILTNLADTPNQLTVKLAATALGVKPATASILDGERSEVSRPVEGQRDWHYWVNRGGRAIMPADDEKLRPLTVAPAGDALLIKLLVPAHDYRLVEVLPK